MRIVTSLLIVLILSLGFLALHRQVKEDIDPVRFLPKDTVIYLEQTNGRKKLQAFTKSPLGSTLASLNYAKVAVDMELEDELIKEIINTTDSIRSLFTNRLFNSVIGDFCLLALFPERAWSVPVRPLDNYLEQQLLLITKPDSFHGLLANFLNETSFREIEPGYFGQYRIRRFRKQNEVLSTAVVGDYVLAALQERVLREGLQLYEQESGSLYEKMEFTKIKEHIGNSSSKIYLNTHRLRELADDLNDKQGSRYEQALLSELSAMEGFTAAGVGLISENNIMRANLLLGMERENVPELTAKLLAAPPEDNETLPFVVADSLFYYWSNTVNLRLLWEMYASETDKTGTQSRSFSKKVKGVSGRSVEELTEMVAGDIGVILRPSDMGQFVPIPDTAITVELKDRKGVKDAIDTMVERLDLSLQSRKYKNITYYYWGLYPFENLQPVYAIYKNYLIFANTKAMFTTVVDLLGDKDPLISSIAFKPIDPGFEKPSNSVCYINQSAFLGHLRELISWSGTILAIQDRQAAAKSKKLIDEFFDPLLLGLSMYEKGATRTWTEENWMITESIIQVNKQ